MLMETGTNAERHWSSLFFLAEGFLSTLLNVSFSTLHITWHLVGINKFSWNELFMRIESLFYDFILRLMEYSY